MGPRQTDPDGQGGAGRGGSPPTSAGQLKALFDPRAPRQGQRGKAGFGDHRPVLGETCFSFCPRGLAGNRCDGKRAALPPLAFGRYWEKNPRTRSPGPVCGDPRGGGRGRPLPPLGARRDPITVGGTGGPWRKPTPLHGPNPNPVQVFGFGRIFFPHREHRRPPARTATGTNGSFRFGEGVGAGISPTPFSHARANPQ